VHCLNPTPTGDSSAHWSEFLQSQVARMPPLAEALRQMLRSIRQRGVARRQGKGSIICIHPGSGSALKCWPAEQFLELIGLFQSAGDSVRVVFGEAELEKWPASRIESFAKVAEVVKPKTYLELATIMIEASLWVGNDSGPSHLAGICG